MKKYLSLFPLLIVIFVFIPQSLHAQRVDEIDGSIMSTPEERSLSPEEKSVEDASQVSKTKTIKDCEQSRDQILEACKKTIQQDTSDPAALECRKKSREAYYECLKSVDPAEMKKSNPEGEFELPSGISGLNQFQSLSLSEVIGNFMGMTMKILGSIAFALMVGAGLLWMTAGGNSDRQRKALDTMVWAALGVVMILSSATIVKFVFDAFTN